MTKIMSSTVIGVIDTQPGNLATRLISQLTAQMISQMVTQPMTSLITRAVTLLFALLLTAGCATHVEVSGSFPAPLTLSLPLNAVVVFDKAFRTHRFESVEGREVSIDVGQTQVDLFTAVSKSMFRETHISDALPTDSNADLILVPKVEDVQISMPYQTKLNVFEVWIKYNLQVYDRNGEPVADWIMSAYGKTPTKFLKSDSEALNQAAIVALRDAGAHFVIGFTRVPEISHWLHNQATRAARAERPAL